SELSFFREDGIAKFEGSLPHSITKWFVQAVSVSPEGGICVAEPAEVTAFRKVFLQVDLPYKVVRNEQVEVLVTVYNYGPDLLYGAVFLHGVPGVCTGARHQLRPDRKPVEVKAQSATSVTFPVIPTLEGKHTIRILVNTSQGKDSVEKILNVVTMLKVTARAENFLNERINLTREPYVAALVAYALSLDKGEKKQEAFQILKDHLLYDEEMNELSTGNDATALEVEGTSYALLAYLRHGDMEGGARLVNWLNRHRSASGSFTSTQDTVVALQALTESGLKARDSSPDLMCNITANRPKNIFHLFRINRKNAFVLQEVHIKDIGGKLLLSVSGEGTGVLTARLRYNVLTPPEKLCKFSLAVRASRPEPGQTRGGRSRMVPQEVWKELLGDADPARILERMRGHSMIENGRASLST
ncbi:hypothetical protein HPB47_015736, partial [Ixodes persulcatus]